MNDTIINKMYENTEISVFYIMLTITILYILAIIGYHFFTKRLHQSLQQENEEEATAFARRVKLDKATLLPYGSMTVGCLNFTSLFLAQGVPLWTWITSAVLSVALMLYSLTAFSNRYPKIRKDLFENKN